MKSKILKLPYIVLLLAIGIFVGIQIDRLSPQNNLQTGGKAINDVLGYAEKYYVDKIDTAKLVESAINGMLNTLDPHTVYIPKDEMQSVGESLDSNFQGIGIEFQIINDTIVVVSPLSGGPSETLGIQSGDRIVKIDGKSAIGISIEQVRQKLMGKAGTKVNVTIERYGSKNLLNFEITRASIPLYSVDASFMLNKNIGYVSLSKFSENSYDELIKALNELKSKGMTQLILDLRGNPGGYLSQAVKIADIFISDHKKIVYTKGREKQFDEEYDASESSPYEKIPLIILVNHGSASASEIVSGAIQDWDRGLIVGETTFGKGLVQRQYNLPNKSGLRLTIAKYYTPSGRCIQRDYKDLKNREEYFTEVENDSEKPGNNLYHTEEKDSSLKTYKTHAGRTVYGGGGITPDYILKSENRTNYTINLLKNRLIYEFSLEYYDKNKNTIKSSYPNLEDFINNFTITDDKLNNFTGFVSKKGVKFSRSDFNKDKEYVRTRLKAQIARDIWKNTGWFKVMDSIDNQLKKAETLFNEAKDLANLK
jgi:carboxyl-terminal processing protease